MKHRIAPTCPECGEQIKAKHYQTQTFVAGDTFSHWDWKSHKCRIGIKYFIERTDTNYWWYALTAFTNDPMAATMFDTREEAEKFLKESNVIPARLDCIVTEHEFVRVHPAREKNLKDALTGLR